MARTKAAPPEGTVICPYCGVSVSRELFERHVRRDHPEYAEPIEAGSAPSPTRRSTSAKPAIRRCAICKEEFSPYAFREHVKTHTPDELVTGGMSVADAQNRKRRKRRVKAPQGSSSSSTPKKAKPAATKKTKKKSKKGVRLLDHTEQPKKRRKTSSKSATSRVGTSKDGRPKVEASKKKKGRGGITIGEIVSQSRGEVLKEQYRMDATKGYAHAYREHGRFGSHPGHDNFDD